MEIGKETMLKKTFTYRDNLGLILIFGIFLFLRLYHLGFRDFWYDEIVTVGYTKYPWANWNAPLYWILLHYWVKVFGFSEFSLRFPSLVFNFLSVILVFLLGKRLFNKKAAILAAIFMGLSPFQLWYAQEARDYSMLLFFSTLSTYLLFRAVKENYFRQWLLFIAVSLLGIYSNYFYLFLFLGQGLYLIFLRGRRPNFKTLICLLIIVFGFLPYLPRFLSKFYFIWEGFWLEKPEWEYPLITLENFMLGYNAFLALYLIADCLMILFLAYFIRNFKDRKLRPALMLCLALLILPMASAFAFSRLFFPVYLDRGLIISSPYLYLALSFGAVSMPKRWLGIASITAFCCLLFFSIYAYNCDMMFNITSHHSGAFLKKPFKPVARFIANNLEEADIIAVTNINPPITASLSFYCPQIKYFYFFFVPPGQDPNWKRPITESKLSVPAAKIGRLEFKRLWLLACDGGPRTGRLDEDSQSVKDYCDRNFRLQLRQEFDGLWVFRYVKQK